MSGLIKAIIICLVAILLIVPIGIGAWTGLTGSNDGGADNSSQGNGGETNLALSLSDSEVSFNIGATKTLTANIAVESKSYIFLWDTTDKNVVSVRKSSGAQNVCEVTATGAGEATVTVSIIDVIKFKIVDSVTCKFTVIDTSINFGVDEVIISLDKGNSATVSATAPENGEITWSSMDESVATVENGVITAHKAGTTYIIARSGDIEGKLPVKVYKSVFTLEQIKLVAAGDSTGIQVDGTISEGAVWTSSDDRIVSVDQNGVITANKLGMATIKVKSVVDDLESSCVVVVKSGSEEAVQLESGKKAVSAANPGKWYFLCESENVTIGDIPTLDNGVISAHVTHVGDANGKLSGNNFFYLRYQPDTDGDIIYKHSLYIYSDSEVVLQINGKDVVYPAGYNRYEIEYISSAPSASNPYQIKFRCTGKFYVIPVFEEIGRIEKMTLSSTFEKLNTVDKTSVTLTATVPNNTAPVIEWSSSNENVATVVDGVVTAVGEGSTMITARYSNLSATCIITVEGESPLTGVELKSGNKSAAVDAPGKWFYLKDGKSSLNYTPIVDEEDNIHLSVNAVDNAGNKYVYLRYQPETAGTYKVVVTIEFAGVDNSVVEISGGNKSAEAKVLVNGTNTFELEFTSDTTNPFQMKFKAGGNYVVNVEMIQEVG